MQFLSTSYKLLNAIVSNKHKTIDCKGKKSVWESGTALKYCRQESNKKHIHTERERELCFFDQTREAFNPVSTFVRIT